ncbi:MAG TPA: lysylphosphatidylglycerol synthase domain-containing protein [Bacteroidota bacterium]|nr:lysylphosphatidylglycerol synthase domain-containing protein [Bacteroidota bacterium]
MSNRIKYIVLAIGFIVFSYLVYSYGVANIWQNLLRTGWWFLPVVFVWAAVYYCNAWAWFVILRDHHPDIRFSTIYRLTITAFSLNYVTPFLSLGGEPYRVAALSKTVDKHRGISSVILYNMIRWMAHFSFWLSAIVIALITVTLAPAAVISLVIIGCVLILSIGFFVSRHKYGIFEALFSWMSRKRVLQRFLKKLDPHRAALLSIDEQIKQLYQHQQKTFYTSIFFEYLSRIAASFEFFFILKALGFAPTFMEAFYINAATSFILNMLFFVPFELGTREGGLYFVMQSVGYAQGIGIFISLVNRLRELVWTLIGMALMLKTEKQPSTASFIKMMEDEQKQ